MRALAVRHTWECGGGAKVRPCLDELVKSDRSSMDQEVLTSLSLYGASDSEDLHGEGILDKNSHDNDGGSGMDENSDFLVDDVDDVAIKDQAASECGHPSTIISATGVLQDFDLVFEDGNSVDVCKSDVLEVADVKIEGLHDDEGMDSSPGSLAMASFDNDVCKGPSGDNVNQSWADLFSSDDDDTDKDDAHRSSKG